VGGELLRWPCLIYRVGQKSKLLILSEYVNKTEKIGGMWTNKNSYREMKYCLIFSRKIFYVTIVLCLNIVWLYAVNEITAKQTRTSLCKHDVIKVCSIEYLTTQIELVLPLSFNSGTVHQIIEYLTLGLLSGLRNIYHSTTAYFFDQPCMFVREHISGASSYTPELHQFFVHGTYSRGWSSSRSVAIRYVLPVLWMTIMTSEFAHNGPYARVPV